MKVYRDVKYELSDVRFFVIPGKIYSCVDGWVDLGSGEKVGYSPDSWFEYTGPVPAGFILWDGGLESPVGMADVEIFLSDGSTSQGSAANFVWTQSELREHIIAYRIVEEDKEVKKGDAYKVVKQFDPEIPDSIKPVVCDVTEETKQKKYDAMPDRLKRLAVHELIVDIDDLDNRHDAFDVAKQLELKGYAMDEQCVKDLSEYLQSIAK